MAVVVKPMRLPPLPSVKDLLNIYQLKATKKLSQNFLLDNKLQSKLVKMSGNLRNSYVIEIGPGPGCLTRSIFEQGAAIVHVIEKDKRFIPALQLLQDATNGRLHIHIGDILRFNLEALYQKDIALPWDGPVPKVHIIGNLPFSVSTPLIFQWLEQISTQKGAWTFGRVPMTLTFQEEVAERMVAPPNTPSRGRLSIMCQNWCEVSHKFVIPGKAFVPKPDVNVSVVHFIPRVTPVIDLNFKLLEKVVFALFSKRRKYCKKGIGTLFPKNLKETLSKKLLTVADIDHTLRPYELTMSDFSRIAHCYSAFLEEYPELKKY